MPLTGPLLVAAGRLAAVAVACGFNLYATVAFLGLASRVGWFVLPVGLRGLENTVVIASAGALYLAEAIIDKFPYVDAIWEGVHTLIRPVATGLLATLVFPSLAAWQTAGVGLAVGLVTLGAHGAKAGLRVASRTPGRPALRFLLSVGEDAAAIAIAFAALRSSLTAGIVAVVVLALLFVAGPGLWRAGILGVRSFAARLRAFFGESRWRHADEVPAALRKLLEPDPHGIHPHRAARVAVVGLPGPGNYRNGWLVLDHGTPVFLFRRLLAARRVELPRAEEGRVRHGLMLDVLELESTRQRFAIFLLKDGPSARTALSELVSA